MPPIFGKLLSKNRLSLPQSSLRHIPALDGLRAIAVLLVMLVHFGKLQAGWIGVHLFFVLSGFLITGILLHERERQPHLGPYLKRFIWRRSLRIFPAYYLYIGVLFALAALTGILSGLGDEAPTLLTYTQNWKQVLSRPGIGEGPELGHLWSLCVEEQFYLVWPFVIFLIPKRILGPFLIALVVLGPAIRWLEGLWMMAHWQEDYIRAQSLYMMTTTHLDALALGAVIAYYRLHEKIQRPLLWLFGGLALFLAYGTFAYLSLPATGMEMRPSTLGYTYNTLHLNNHIWSFTSVNLAMAGALLAAAGKANPFKSILENKWLMSIGAVSYGLYLWHHLVLTGIDAGLEAISINSDAGLGLALRFILFLSLSILWAKLLFSFFEAPFLRLKDKVGHVHPHKVGV